MEESLKKKVMESFIGKVVRKDLAFLVKGNLPVPTYVLEYLLGQYCATDDEEVIAQTVRLLTGGHRVYFIGLGNSGFVADDSAYKFQRIGIEALGLDNSHLIMLHMALIQPGDVVISISHSGASKEIVQAARLA